ncbi:MAG TPA: hypothetical protein VLB12_11110 [Gemmatimonadales bacterium]|nr:hypothetical protein [Gemmatimonadales bacterium]
MSRTGTILLAGLCATLPGRPLAAQHPVEYGVHGVATFATPDLVVGGGYAAVRPAERARLAVTLAAGTADGDMAFRGELLAHFLLSPQAKHGVGFYALGGAAVADLQSTGDTEGYMVLGLGVESRPGARSGWALEAGIGGGLRIAVGYRWRRLP